MAAQLSAIVVHSILEIVRGISDEGENVEIRGILTHNSVSILCTSIPIDCGFMMPITSDQAQTGATNENANLSFGLALVWAFHIVCI